MSAVIYIRVSSDEQVSGTSLESQERVCRAFAAQRGLDVAEVFADRGESAKTADRPEFQRIIRYCAKTKGVEALIVWKLDRFARNNFDYAVNENLLSRCGVRLLSATEYNDDSAYGKGMQVITSAIAQIDNAIRAERACESMRSLAADGYWVHAAPIGYALARDDRRRPMLQAHPVDGDVVRSAFRMVAEGQSLRRVLEHVTAAGLRTSRGGQLTNRMLHDVLRNRVYIGIVRSKLTDGVEIPGRFRQLISDDLFARVQLVLSGRGVVHKVHERTTDAFPLRGFVSCSDCGHMLTASHSRGRSMRYGYYHCHYSGCRSVRVRDEQLHADFLELLKSATEISSGKMRLLRHHIRRIWEYRKAEARQIEHIAADRREKIEQKRAKLLDKLLGGVISDDTYQRADADLNLEIAEIRVARNDAEISELQIDSALAFADRLAANAADVWNRLGGANRERFQNLLFPGGMTYSKNQGLRTVATPISINALHNDLTKKCEVAPLSVLSWNRVARFVLAMNEAERCAA